MIQQLRTFAYTHTHTQSYSGKCKSRSQIQKGIRLITGSVLIHLNQPWLISIHYGDLFCCSRNSRDKRQRTVNFNCFVCLFLTLSRYFKKETCTLSVLLRICKLTYCDPNTGQLKKHVPCFESKDRTTEQTEQPAIWESECWWRKRKSRESCRQPWNLRMREARYGHWNRIF